MTAVAPVSPAPPSRKTKDPEEELLKRWSAYLIKYPLKGNHTPRTNKKFVALVRTGVAEAYREQIWLQASGAYLLKATEPEFYKNVCKVPVDESSVAVRDIDKVRRSLFRHAAHAAFQDIGRTYVDHPLFVAEHSPALRQLRNILVAYCSRHSVRSFWRRDRC